MTKLLRMAWRNVWRNWRRTTIAVVAIALGLTLLLSFDGMLSGAEEASYGNTVKLLGGNVQAHAPGYLERAKRLPLYPLADAQAIVQAAKRQRPVVAVSRRIKTGGMVSSREGTFPVVITGIEPEQEGGVSLISGKITQGRNLTAGDQDVLLVGQALATRLQVAVGDRVELVGRATHEQMRRRTMMIVGVYDLRIPDVEKRMVYISLAEGQALFDLRDQATEVVISLASVGQEETVITALRAGLPGYEIDAWYTLNPETKQAMEMNKQMMGLFGMVILLIAGVGVLNLMLMAVLERTREIGLLAAMGLKRWEIMVLFLLEGMLIGLIGALVGTALGGAVIGYYGQVGMEWATEYSEMAALLGGRIYFAIGADLLLLRGLTVVIIAALASIIPAWQASRREPAEALHYV